MGMEALSLATMGHETFSESESAGDDFQNESPKKELVTMYLGGAREVTYPSQKDRALRLLEVARIVLYDFGLDWNDAYEIVMKFNQSHVSPPVDEAWVKDIVDFAWNHYWTEKDPGWRLDAEQDRYDGEYSIYNHSFILNTSKPNISAKAFLRSRCSVRGMPGLRFFQGAYWAWDGSRYIKTEESQVRSMLEDFLEMAVVRVNDGCMRFPSTMPNVLTPIMESAQRLVLLPNDIQLPYYLDAGASPEVPGTLIIGRSKTLRLRDRAVFDSKPCWFSTGTLDLDPDPHASEPVEWNGFLDSVFDDDQLSKDLLHEFMGLVVAGDISHQKMLTMIGPTRSGKGTTLGVMEKLVGPGNFCALALSQLNEKFGLANLPGKKLVELNEAYFGNTAADRKMVEKLLSMIGGDMVPIEQKYKNTFSTRIDGRIVMSTNKLPELTNIGSALSARLLPLIFTKSFAGSEDVNLGAKFEPELPGILNLALDGLERLRSRGHFILPPSSEEMLSRMRRRFDPLLGEQGKNRTRHRYVVHLDL